jgi:hypothetical protein
MTVLLVLVVVYFAVVSAPISIRSFGLVLARSRLRELPLPWRLRQDGLLPGRLRSVGGDGFGLVLRPDRQLV